MIVMLDESVLNEGPVIDLFIAIDMVNDAFEAFFLILVTQPV